MVHLSMGEALKDLSFPLVPRPVDITVSSPRKSPNTPAA
jgi:hypothetical protein